MSFAVSGVVKTSPSRRVRVILGILLGLVFALTGALSASAHAELEDTTPENGAVLDDAPEAAELQFNETVQLIENGIRLFPAEGAASTLDAQIVDTAVVAELPDALADGSYALAYRVVSADGHPIAGAITFQIGSESPDATVPTIDVETPPATETAVSLLSVLQYLGILVFVGLLFFDRVIRPAAVLAVPGIRRLLPVSLAAAALASVLLVPVSAMRIAGVPLDGILDPGAWLPGFFWQPAVAAVAVTLFGCFALLLARHPSSRAGAAATACAVLGLTALLLVGHSQTLEPRWLIVLADLGHLAAAAFWIGGLIGLILLVQRARTQTLEQAVDVVSRFSRFALYSVIVLVLSGALMAVMILDEPVDLIDTIWGRSLLLKIGIVLPVIALALWNRTRLLPYLRRRAADEHRWHALRRILSYEAALLVAVITITGFLTNTSPGYAHESTSAEGSYAAQPTEILVESQGLTVHGEVEFGTPGESELRFRLEYDGEAVATEQVQVQARLPEQDLGPLAATVALDSASGEYTALVPVPVSGEWEIEISARVSTYAQPIAIIPVMIGE